MNVTVVGLGKLGAPLAALLATAGHTVRGMDLSQKPVDAINERRAPVEEPQLQELIDALPEGRLTATTDYEAAMDGSDISLIIVPTPSDENGCFSNEYVLDAIRGIGPHINANWHTVVICSTVMPGSTGGPILRELERASKRIVGRSVGLCYSPEFIALGSVLNDMLNPDVVLVGAEDSFSASHLEDLVDSYLYPRRRGSDYQVPYRRLSFTEAELAKISVNTYITMKISYANTIGMMADALGVDAGKVLDAVGADSRIGTKYLKPGASYGGPCFPRDTVAFASLGVSLGVQTPLAQATDDVNEQVISQIMLKLVGHQQVAILGMAYKPGTPVTEESMGRKLLKALRDDSVVVTTHDVVARGEYADAERCMRGASAVVIATPYEEYAKLDYGNRLVIDPWGLR